MYSKYEKVTSSSKAPPFRGSKPSEREGRHNPKVIGEIPGYPVGSKFKNRDDLSGAGVHAPLRAGIHGNKADGAYSVVLSYGYEDDEDSGETFIYTGQGGRSTDSSRLEQMQGKESWSNHQASDQEWKLGNKALQISWLRGTPVRVIRGAPRKSAELYKYAPSEGLRYDGLYQVTEAWKDEGATGFQTCKFLFNRLPNQLPLPGGHASSPNLASSSKKYLQVPLPTSHRVPRTDHQSRQPPNPTKPSPAAKPPRARAPFVPRPPYRPSEADIAKLKSTSRSKSTSHSITPEYAGAAPCAARPRHARPNNNNDNNNNASHYQDQHLEMEMESGCPMSYADEADCGVDPMAELGPAEDEDETAPIPGPVFARSASPDLEDRRKRRGPRGGFSEECWGVSDEESRGGTDEESDGDVRPWAMVRGKQKLPSSLSFKKRRVD